MILSFLYNRKNLYIIGFIITIVVTFLEFARGRDMNFIVFADATRDFWQGTSPYTDLFVTQHGRFFLYSPVFTVLFAPFAFLPSWLGPFAWNLFNYTLFFAAVFSLPERFTNRQKYHIFLFLLPILSQSLLSFQYNISVTYIFLFAFTLLEEKRGLWAVILIMISGCTKIYGIFELALLVCYPRFWRNAGFALLCGVLLLALPLLKLSPAGFFPYYVEWFGHLSDHQSHTTYESLFHIRTLSEWLLPHFRMLQIGALGVLALLFLGNFKKWSSPIFRAQALGILMGWVVLFSDSAESHTYLIALAGFMLWYWSRQQHTALLQEISDIEIVDIPHAGKGAAVRAGIARSKAPYAIYTDIDIPYTLETMCEVIDRMLGGSDLVIAVRNKSYHSQLSPLRKLLSWGSKILNRIFLDTCYTDTQGGLKGVSQRAGEITLRTRINDYLFDTEFIVLASRDKSLRIEEIESTLREGIVMSKMSTRVMFRELKNFVHIAVRL